MTVQGFAITLYVLAPAQPDARDLGELLRAAIEQARRSGNAIAEKVTVERVSVGSAAWLVEEKAEAERASEERRARRRGRVA